MINELFKKIKGKNRIETLENIFIILVWFFASIISIGILLSATQYKTLSFYLASFGSFGIFIFLTLLIIVIFIKESKK